MVRVLLSTSLAGLVICLVAGFAEYPYWNKVPFVSPVSYSDQLPIRLDSYGNGAFGTKRSGGRRHRGIDITALVGTSVYAVRSGRVVKANYHRGYGHFIVIDHGRGFQSLYAHLSQKKVKRGERVRQGQEIGLIGKTGNARRRAIQPHLHFEWIENGKPVDPTSLMTNE